MMILQRIRRVGVPVLVLVAATLAAAQFLANDVIRYRTYETGLQSRVERQSFFILNNEAEFQRYWQTAQGQPPQTAPRGIDWGREQLVAFHIGRRPTAGYSAQVGSIQRVRPNEVVAEFVELLPVPGQMQAQVVTSPWIIIRMDRTPGTLSFRTRMEQTRPGFGVIPPVQRCVCECTCCRSGRCRSHE
jgi:hypothetical protein